LPKQLQAAAKVVFICIFLLPAAVKVSSPNVEIIQKKRESITRYLPAIAWVESRSNQWAYSYRGQSYGRGLHGISEICYTHWTWYHGNHCAVKQKLDPSCLYNPEVNETVAAWYLQWLENYYNGMWNRDAWVLSAYCYGPTYVDQHGLQSDYITKVMAAMAR
jgi:hypothetical protein